MICTIAGICLVLLRCNKDDSSNNTYTPSHYTYQLKLEFKDETWPGGRFDWELTDFATLDIDVTDSIVTISNIQNDNGSVSPASQFFENSIESCTSTWQPGESVPGYINITGGSGKTYGGMGQPVMMTLSITSSQGRTPKFIEVWTRSGTYITGGDSLMTLNFSYNFELNDETQTSPGVLTATLIPN